MSLSVGELFLSLGVKGTDKTKSALSDIGKGIKGLSEMSLEAKAALAGALYALERMLATSGAKGTALTNLSSYTQASTKALQQWEYAARQAGLSSEEMDGSLKGVQQTMDNMRLGKGAPEGFGWIQRAVGLDPEKAKSDVTYVLNQLQKAAQILPRDVGNTALKSFGLSEGLIAAARRGKLTESVRSQAPTYGANEIASLDKANVAWSNLGNKIEMAIGHFNAKHGQSLVKDFSMIIDQVFKLANAFQNLSDKISLFERLSELTAGVANSIKLINDAMDKLSGKSGKDNLLNGEALPGVKESPVGQFIQGLFHSSAVPSGASIAPPKINVPQIDWSKAQTVNVNQNITHHGDAKDTKSVKDTHKHAINHAFRSNPTQGQVS